MTDDLSRSSLSLLDQLCAAVAARAPIDDRERVSCAQFLERVDELRGRGADPLDQRDDPVHITGSGIVVGSRGVVLLKHKRLGIWVQPGGHIDPGETPWEAARRETIEETGLAVEFAAITPDGSPELLHVDVHSGGRGHTHLDLRYLLIAGDADPSPPAGESQDVFWFSWPDALTTAEPALHHLLHSLSLSVSDTQGDQPWHPR